MKGRVITDEIILTRDYLPKNHFSVIGEVNREFWMYVPPSEQYYEDIESMFEQAIIGRFYEINNGGSESE